MDGHQPRARQAEMLVVGGNVEIGAALLDACSADRRRRCAGAGRCCADSRRNRWRWRRPTSHHGPREAFADTVPSRCRNEPTRAFDTRRGRQADAGLGDDVDDAADRAVAVEHRAAVAAGDLDALDALARDGAEIDAGEIEIVEPAAVDQDQRV